MSQAFSDASEIRIDIGVADYRQLLLDFFRGFRPDLDVLLEREEIYASAVCQEQQKDSQQNIAHAEALEHKEFKVGNGDWRQQGNPWISLLSPISIYNCYN